MAGIRVKEIIYHRGFYTGRMKKLKKKKKCTPTPQEVCIDIYIIHIYFFCSLSAEF